MILRMEPTTSNRRQLGRRTALVRLLLSQVFGRIVRSNLLPLDKQSQQPFATQNGTGASACAKVRLRTPKRLPSSRPITATSEKATRRYY
jgi:hypothetical protein